MRDKIQSFDSRFSWNIIMSSKNRNAKYFLFVIDVSTKYSWIKPFKDKKVKQLLMLLSKQ